jgi:hypothetical protein
MQQQQPFGLGQGVNPNFGLPPSASSNPAGARPAALNIPGNNQAFTFASNVPQGFPSPGGGFQNAFQTPAAAPSGFNITTPAPNSNRCK